MDREANIGFINEKNKNNTYNTPFNIDFVGKKKIFFIISAVIILIGIISFFVFQFNWGIDFVGGTVLQYNIGRTLDKTDTDDIERIVSGIIGSKYSSIQITERTGVTVKALELSTEERDSVFQALAAEYNLTTQDILQANNVNPTVGNQLTESTIWSVLVAVVLMLIYITIRFDFFSGAAAVLCLVHDLFVMLTFYSLLQIIMDTSVIAAFLTILGYSINATIIVFDRVRENRKTMRNKRTFEETVNLSINQTLMRSINTTVTTLLTIMMIYILGVTSIRDFVLPLIVGIISGLYSSVCLSGILWSTFKPVNK